MTVTTNLVPSSPVSTSERDSVHDHNDDDDDDDDV